jgi:NADH-quinone oxidoreductase subunit M
VSLSPGGFGLTPRALEARYGRLSLDEFHGLYEHSPILTVCFLPTGLASVGFPGTLGFVASELLAEGAVQASLPAGVVVVAAAALNGIAVVRTYFLLFTGARHFSSVSLAITARERFVLLTLTALILGGGLFPQPGAAYLHAVAEQVLQARGPAANSRAMAEVTPSGSPSPGSIRTWQRNVLNLDYTSTDGYGSQLTRPSRGACHAFAAAPLRHRGGRGLARALVR